MAKRKVVAVLTVSDRVAETDRRSMRQSHWDATFAAELRKLLRRRYGPSVKVAESQDDDEFESLVCQLVPEGAPAPEWLDQARRNAEARLGLLEEFGALTSAEVADLVGSTASNRRAAASRLVTQRQLFSVEHHGQQYFPGFQFDHATGAPLPAVADVLALLPPDLLRAGWALALWWVTPRARQDWSRPVDLLDDTDRLLEAASQESREWAEANPHADQAPTDPGRDSVDETAGARRTHVD